MAAPPRLILAAYEGDIDSLRRALELGEDPNQVDENGNDAVQIASFRNKPGAIQLLAAYSARLDQGDCYGTQAIHHAAGRGHLNAVRMLLRFGVDINARNTARWTPLHFAARSGQDNVIELLLQEGADPTICCIDGKTPALLCRNAETRSLLETAMDTSGDAERKGGKRTIVTAWDEER